VLLTDFCNRPTSRAPATDRSIPGMFGPLSQSAHVPTESPPPDTPGRLALDGAIRASVEQPLTLPADAAVAGVPESWWAPISASPRRDAPRSAALSSAGEECASTSDAPCRDELRAFRDEPALADPRNRRFVRRQNRLCSEPRQGLCFRAIRGAFHRRVPARPAAPFRRTTNLEREPATGLGALPPFNPASDALSPPRSEEETARPRPLPNALHARALLATRRSSTSAIQTTCKHDLRTSKPDSATVARLSPSFHLAGRSTFRSGHRRFYPTMIQSKGSRGFTGQGPFLHCNLRLLCRPPPP